MRPAFDLMPFCLSCVMQEIAQKLITSSINVDDEGKPLNPLDAHFRSLGLTSMDPVARNSSEFTALSHYVSDTHGQTHHFKASILNAFRVQREGETSAYLAKGYDKLAPGDRMLLWHGSRTTNFAGEEIVETLRRPCIYDTF
jgi:poly [ADP-ribose] polymerase